MQFRHERIDGQPPCHDQMICKPTDLTGNGRPDVIVNGNEPAPKLYWYENPGWERHVIHTGSKICPGAALGDVTGNGRLDLIGADVWNGREVFWFEQPEDPTDDWEKHVICDDFHGYHDQWFGDVDDDGEPEVLFVSQSAEVVCYYDVPDDPRGDGWSPLERTFIDAGVGYAEGIQVLDLDGDGRTEVVIGRRIYSRRDGAGEEWTSERVAPSWDDERVRVVAADVDDDGVTELVLSEGELPALGKQQGVFHEGRLGICSPPNWEAAVLRDDLQGPHSLQVADLDGDGLTEIYVGETDFGSHHTLRHLAFTHDGDDNWQSELLHQGTGTHQAKAADLTGDGSPDIVGKSDTEDAHVDVWYNES